MLNSAFISIGFWTLGALAQPTPISALPDVKTEVAKPTECNSSRETVPAKVNIQDVFKDVLSLKDSANQPIVGKMNPELKASLKKLFEADPAKISKLEQFFGLLYQIAKHKSLTDRKVVFNTPDVRKLLL